MKTFKHPSYTYQKGGVYYFSKAVPKDLAHYYVQRRIVKSLRTKSLSRAKTASRSLASKLEDYWLGLRLQEADIPAAHLLVTAGEQLSSEFPTIEDALDVYLAVKGQSKGKLFFSHAKRNVSYLVACIGSRPLDCYSTADAATFREWLVNKGLGSSSIVRVFSVIKAIVNFCIREKGLDCKNPFSGIYLPTERSRKRYSIKDAKLNLLQRECILLDDEIRWLVALISDSGMRLSEAVGLLIDDLVLDCQRPHINVRPHPHRGLKTAGSERLIPLVGVSLWAANRIKNNTEGKFCFPRYCDETSLKSNSASAAINKWLKAVVGSHAVLHGLRHGFRDRLRSVEAPVELIDQLGGWSLRSVGEGYGDGYPMDVLDRWMQRMVMEG